MTDVIDTETMLAIIASLLEPPIPQQAVLLDALISANGDVEAAANSLRDGQPTQTTRKRVASGVLDGWLTASPSKYSSLHKKAKTSVTTKTVPSQAHNGESSKTISVVLLKDAVQPPPLSVTAVSRLASLTLSSPALVEKHTSCTLHSSVLPSELASRLFYVMVEASKRWTPNKWWLFDRVVESPHKTAFYVRNFNGVTDDESWHEAAQYWYNGRPTATPSIFPSEMEEACQIIEGIVNHTLQSRHRYPLEWGGSSNGLDCQTWKANVAASNCYTGGKEGVGFHSDQLTYLGPFPTIASLSLGTSRTFRLREVIPSNEAGTRQAQTFNIPVTHNSLVIMHASTQERFKHSIPPQRTIDLFRSSYPPPLEMQTEKELCISRINITFRFYRPDFHPKSIPRCRCDIPCVLRANMKRRVEIDNMNYFWMCYAGAQNNGKGCGFVKVMDCKSEGRGPFIGDQEPSPVVRSS